MNLKKNSKKRLSTANIVNRSVNKRVVNKIIIISFIILTLTFLTINTQKAYSINNISSEVIILSSNFTNFTAFKYDRSNTTIGSNSYMDDGYKNPDIALQICNPNMTNTSYLDVAYTTINKSLYGSVLNLKSQTYNITNIQNSTINTNCSTINIDLSSVKAVYPGYITPILFYTYENTTTTFDNTTNTTITIKKNVTLPYFFNDIPYILNGSYKVQISVDGFTRTYYISVQKAIADDNQEIEADVDNLLISLTDKDNNTIVEGKKRIADPIPYDGSFFGGEKVYVNKIKSLEIKVFDPCGTINESGYYILNDSAWNVNETCLKVENESNLVVNFAGEILDGDGNESGSLNNSCAVYIKNSINVTLEDLKVQEFKYGICVENSTVNVIGNTTVLNKIGAYVYDNSTVNLIDVLFSNEELDIDSLNNSNLNLYKVNVTTALIKAETKNVKIKAVPNPPPPPNITNATDIDQYVLIKANSNDSFLKLSFHYEEPLPNKVVADNLSIFKYNGTYINVSYFNSTTNTTQTRTEWVNGTWTQLYTLISPSEQLIIGPNLTSFSVFAPFGFETNVTQPEPTPTPTPTPTSGTGGGGGSTPSSTIPLTDATPYNLAFNLSLPKKVELQQGEAGEVTFNITNIGDLDAKNVVIKPLLEEGWEYTNYTIELLRKGAKTSGSFTLAPNEKFTPGTYYIPIEVSARVFNGTKYVQAPITKELLKIIVLPRKKLNRIKILEYPPTIELSPQSKIDVSFLAKNIGDNDLENIIVKGVSNKKCLKNIEGVNSIKKGETKKLKYTFISNDVNEECDYTLKFYSGEKLVGFVPVKIVVKPKNLIESRTFRLILLIIILALWTLLTITIIHKRMNE